MTLHLVRRRLPVSWSDLLEAYQWYVAYDDSTHPCVDLQTGRVTCPAVQGLQSAEEAEGRLAPMPLKGPLEAFEQRRNFAESVCDTVLREELLRSLGGPRPFRAYDEALVDVPVEAVRWREEERINDLQTLDVWLASHGVDPDPPPDLTRTVLAFPRRRDL